MLGLLTVDQDDADEEFFYFLEAGGGRLLADSLVCQAVACAYRWLPFSNPVDCGL